jgi:hypothetical protein
MDGQVIGLLQLSGVADDLCFQIGILQNTPARVYLDSIHDQPPERIRSFIIIFQQLAEAGILLYQILIGLFELEIIFDAIVLLVDPAGELRTDIHKGGFVELVIAKEKGKGYYLQHQEEEEVKMPSDEEKNVTHRCVVYFGVLVLNRSDVRPESFIA